MSRRNWDDPVDSDEDEPQAKRGKTLTDAIVDEMMAAEKQRRKEKEEREKGAPVTKPKVSSSTMRALMPPTWLSKRAGAGSSGKS